MVCAKIFCVRIFDYPMMSVCSSSSSEKEWDEDVVPMLANSSDSRELVAVPEPSKKVSNNKSKMNQVVCIQETGPQPSMRVAPQSSKRC
jgi:hypothetical protein